MNVLISILAGRTHLKSVKGVYPCLNPEVAQIMTRHHPKHGFAYCVCANIRHMAMTEKLHKRLTDNHATSNNASGYFHCWTGFLVSQFRHLCVMNCLHVCGGFIQ